MLEAVSTLSDRGQTTIPKIVRQALRLSKGDKLRYTVRPDGNVILRRMETAEADPAIGKFLEFLAADIAAHPERLTSIDPDLLALAKSLTVDVEYDINEKLSPDNPE